MRKAPETTPARPSDTIRVLIADDNVAVRKSFRTVLEADPGMEVVGEAADHANALRLATTLHPDILLLDQAIPGGSGFEALREGADTPWRTLLLAAKIDRAGIVQALQLGAHGIILKNVTPDLLFAGLRAVMHGGYWNGHEGVADLLRELQEHAPETASDEQPYVLTAQERRIVAAIVAGYTSKDIARRLEVPQDSVRRELSNLFDKTGVSNRLELALFAIHHQLVDGELLG